MLEQFFSKKTWWVIGGLIGLHFVAFLCLHRELPSLIALALIAGGLTALTIKRLEYGLVLAFLEVIIGGHGHLFEASIGGFTVSLRLTIFLAVMGTWAGLVMFKRLRPNFSTWRDGPFLVLLAAVTLGVIVGFLHGNPRAVWFDDANSYATLLYLLPLASLKWTNEIRALFIRTLFAGATWVATSTVALLYAFTHLGQQGIWTLYVFVRDARLFEVTLLSGPKWIVSLLGAAPWYFRVFGYGQFYVFIAGIFLLTLQLKLRQTSKGLFGLNTLFLATGLATLSRSFLLAFGGAVGLVGVYIVFDMFRKAGQWSEAWRRVVLVKMGLMGSMLVAMIGLWAVTVVPVPARPDLMHSPFYKGQNDDTRDLAVSSRWNLLPPLMRAIGQHPLLGSGFGQEVTYISDDPRLRAVNPTGEYTTYRFEWGFQDIWLKMGLLGLLAAAIILAASLYRALDAYRRDLPTAWLSVSAAAGVVFLYLTHIFSPFINHPIGLMFLLFAAFIVEPTERPITFAKPAFLTTPVRLPSPVPQGTMAYRG